MNIAIGALVYTVCSVSIFCIVSIIVFLNWHKTQDVRKAEEQYRLAAKMSHLIFFVVFSFCMLGVSLFALF